MNFNHFPYGIATVSPLLHCCCCVIQISTKFGTDHRISFRIDFKRSHAQLFLSNYSHSNLLIQWRKTLKVFSTIIENWKSNSYVIFVLLLNWNTFESVAFFMNKFEDWSFFWLDFDHGIKVILKHHTTKCCLCWNIIRNPLAFDNLLMTIRSTVVNISSKKLGHKFQIRNVSNLQTFICNSICRKVALWAIFNLLNFRFWLSSLNRGDSHECA